MAVLRGANAILVSNVGPMVIATIGSIQAITSDDYIIVFDTTTLNKNSSLNTSTGIFTVPEDGYYSLFTRVRASIPSLAIAESVRIVKNSTDIALSRKAEALTNDVLTCNHVAFLSAGETIHVRILNLNGESLSEGEISTFLSISRLLYQ